MHNITEQKQTEEQLAYHAPLFENLHDAVIVIDERSVVTAWNQAAEEMYGWTADEALGRSFWEVAHTDLTEEQQAETLRELAETSRPRMVELAAHRKDGTALYVEVTSTALRGEQGQVTGYLSIERDITERKRFETEQQRLAEIGQNSSDFVGIYDLDWQTVFVNDAGQKLVGLNETEEVECTTVLDYFMLEDRAFVRDELFPTIMEEGRWAGERELRFQHFETGEPIPVLWNAFRIDNPRTGRPIYAAAIAHNITERKRAEKALETRIRQQSVIAELALQALANDDLQFLMYRAVSCVAQILDVEYCKIVELLPGGEELLVRAGVGWEEGLVGNATERADLDSQTGYTLRSNEPVVMEDLSAETRFSPSWLLREHGVVSGVSVVVHGREGPFGVLGAHTASHRTFSEDDVNFLQAVANVISTRIERNEAEEKLREAQEGERSRIGWDLHDETFKNLSYALSEAQEIRSSKVPQQEADRLSRLVATLKRVEQQLRGAIYGLRLEQEQYKPFSELLESLVELHRGMSPDCDIRLNVQDGLLSGSLGETGRDTLRIIGEMLTNARRHSGARTVRVEVGSSEDELWAEISDDGREFDPAQEKPSATTCEGVGIRRVRERTRFVGGDLEIESQPGEEMKVRFELPLKKEVYKEPEEEVHVLLVEVQTTLREALASALERESGFEIVGQAASLAEARRMLAASHEVDVAVVNLGLPDGHGADVIKELRRANPKTQALVLSASLDQAQIARAVEAGAAGVLHKTAHLDEVVEAVRRLSAGETLLSLEEMMELFRFAGRHREQEYEVNQAIEKLTVREKEVLQALADGLDSQEIATQLFIGTGTVRNHVRSICTKLRVNSRLQALVFAVRHGIAEIS